MPNHSETTLRDAQQNKALSWPLFKQALCNTTVIVSALGYFVDIYDLILFSIVRVSSLKSIGVPDNRLLDVGVFLINAQMAGMLLGGVLWGVLGDRKGRLSILLGSIAVYSTANIANAFVSTTEWYAVWRFIAGIGLAGELGAAVTLVSEMMPKETRGYSTTIIASVGISGALVAGLVSNYFDWQWAYIAGGVMGFALLALRIGVMESGMYKVMASTGVSRGKFFKLFSNRKIAVKYLSCIFAGLPIWFVSGILITFSPEIALALGVTGPISAGVAIAAEYTGLMIGDLVSGLISQRIQSRTKVVGMFLGLTLVLIVVHLMLRQHSVQQFYGMCALVGFGIGYWAVFLMIAAEQFGTNLRATVTTTAPNFVRGALVPLLLCFSGLKGHFGVVSAAMMVGIGTVVIAGVALYQLEDCFGKDLDYFEQV